MRILEVTNQKVFCFLWAGTITLNISQLSRVLYTTICLIVWSFRWFLSGVKKCMLFWMFFTFQIMITGGYLEESKKALELAKTNGKSQLFASNLAVMPSGLSEWCSGNIGACHLWGPGSIPGRSRSLCDRVGDSLWPRRFTPGAPVSSYSATKIAQYCLKSQ